MMTPRIVIAYCTILETAIDLEKKADQRPEQMPSYHGQTAAGPRVAASVIKGVCNDDAELSKQLKEIRDAFNGNQQL